MPFSGKFPHPTGFFGRISVHPEMASLFDIKARDQTQLGFYHRYAIEM